MPLLPRPVDQEKLLQISYATYHISSLIEMLQLAAGRAREGWAWGRNMNINVNVNVFLHALNATSHAGR